MSRTRYEDLPLVRHPRGLGGYLRDLPELCTQAGARPYLCLRLGVRPVSGGRLSAALPAEASLESSEAPILNQGPTGSCTGHGTSQGLWTTFQASGRPLLWVPSPKRTYFLGRAYARAATTPEGQPMPALTDSGAMPADVMAALPVDGVRAMRGPTSDGRNSDVDPATIDAEETVADEESGLQALVTGQYRIDPSAPDASDQVAASVVSRAAVGVGGFVDTAFMNWEPGDPPLGPPDTSDPQGGGHWITLTSFRAGSAAARSFPASVGDVTKATLAPRITRGPNSWGPDWGDRGHFEVDDGWIGALWDIYTYHASLVTR